MNHQQKVVLQVIALACVIIVLFPPLTAYSEYGFLFSLYPHEQINFSQLIARLICVALLGAVTYFHFGIQVEKRIVGIDLIKSYWRGEQSFIKTFGVGFSGLFILHYIIFQYLAPEPIREPYTARGSRFLTGIYNEEPYICFGLFFAMLIIYTAWSLHSVWYCAERNKSFLIRFIGKSFVITAWLHFLFILLMTLAWFLGRG